MQEVCYDHVKPKYGKKKKEKNCVIWIQIV